MERQSAVPASFLNSADPFLQGELYPPAATNDGNGPAQGPSAWRGRGGGRGKRAGRKWGGGGEGGRGRGRGRVKEGKRGRGTFVTTSRGRGQGPGVGKNDRSNLNDCGPFRSPNGNLGETDPALQAAEDSPYSMADSADADSFTCKEVLILLAASGHETIQKDLAKFLQAEAKESQERSVAKVHAWLQSQ